jgi:fermentation-respiration switch protein FrsA (DUF1100 family)
VVAILAVLVGVFFIAFLPWFFTRIITTSRYHFPDPNDGKTPKSYGLEFRWIQFNAADGVPLRGWYVPASGQPHGTIIYLHGQNRTRVEMLPAASFACSLGYNGLLFDLRHQGLSGGEISTLGYQERLDVLGALRFARDEEKAESPFIFWGVSMGAAAGLMAAADSPDVDAVISDSSFLSFSDVIIHHAKLFLHLPKFPISEEVIYLVSRRGQFSPADFDLEKAVQRINPRPVLFVAVEGDRRMPPDIARALYSRSTSPLKSLAILPGNRHGEGFALATQQYQRAVTDFLARLPRPSNGLQRQSGLPRRRSNRDAL